MTAQIPELIRIDQEEVQPLASNPLESWLAQQQARPHFTRGGSALWRRYIGTWRILDQRLWLESITDFPLSELFAADPQRQVGENGMVFADWVTEELRVPKGKQVQYVHMGYGSRYERDLILTFQNGRLMLRETVDVAQDRLLRYQVERESLKTVCKEEEWPFIASILEDPIDPERRAVFADWLEERGDQRALLLRITETPQQRSLPEHRRAVLRYEQIADMLGKPPVDDRELNANRVACVYERLFADLSAAARKPQRMSEHIDRVVRFDPSTRTLLRCLGLLPCAHLMQRSWTEPRPR